MTDRPKPDLEPEDVSGGRPLPRGGVSTLGSFIVWVLPLGALLSLAGVLLEVWILAQETSPQASMWHWAGWWILLGLQWLVLFVAGFHLALAWGIRYETSRIRPFISREERQLMLRLMTASRAAPIVYTAWGRYTFAGFLSVIAAVGFASLRPLVVLMAALSLYNFMLVRVTTPPSAVLLGTSDIPDLRWHWTLLNLARPLRTVSCLEVQNAESRWKSMELTFDCLRANSDDWWELVQSLLRLAPLVVIDTTISTSHLVNEARSLLDFGHEFKCMALTGHQGECPLLEEAGIPSSQFCRLKAPEVLRLVKETLASGKLPTPLNPISRIAADLGLVPGKLASKIPGVSLDSPVEEAP